MNRAPNAKYMIPAQKSLPFFICMKDSSLIKVRRYSAMKNWQIALIKQSPDY
jgi:hypothetical protein